MSRRRQGSFYDSTCISLGGDAWTGRGRASIEFRAKEVNNNSLQEWSLIVIAPCVGRWTTA